MRDDKEKLEKDLEFIDSIMDQTKADDSKTARQAAPSLKYATTLARPFELTVPIGNVQNSCIDPATGKKRWSIKGILNSAPISIIAMVLMIYAVMVARHAHFNTWTTLYLLIYSIIPLSLYAGKRAARLEISLKNYGFQSSRLMAGSKWFRPYANNDMGRREWSELECVRFQKADGLSAYPLMLYGRSDCLVFEWKAGKNPRASAHADTSYIPISNFNEEQREQLFTALSQFVPQEVLSPEVLYLQVKTLSGDTSSDLSDYTQVWLDQYTRNFELSNYVTLAPGSLCGNGRFVIGMTIAARINSSTYLAATTGGEKVVIKELLAPIDSDDTMQKKLLEQFNREAAILAKLEHPAIVSIIDHFIENGRSYLVMGHAAGKNIREYVHLQGPFSESEAFKIARQLASVLHYLHHHSPAILHRDFTPDNLMYGHDGFVSVVDFGAANVYNTGKTATLIGKQSYMPPEQLRGKPSPTSDIYAFGATLCFLMTGKDLPSMGKLPAFDQTKTSAGLISLIQRCTSFEAENRPTCDELLKQLKSDNFSPEQVKQA